MVGECLFEQGSLTKCMRMRSLQLAARRAGPRNSALEHVVVVCTSLMALLPERRPLRVELLAAQAEVLDACRAIRQ